MAGERVVIVEDDALLRSVLAERLQHEGIEVATAATLREARACLDAATPDVVLLDLRLPDGEGLELLREVPRGESAWVVMTAHATVSLAVEALKLGAHDFLEKPFSLDRALATVRHALTLTALRREVASLRDKSSLAGTTVIGEGPAMRRVFALVERLAAADATTVLIEGESGTGKGAIAQAIHRLGPRAAKPFMNVTCSALPETLMESELFGHERGAFTDAHAAKRGLVEMADGGTLFLDEIGELTPGVQAKLLRFIEEKTFRRLGGTRDLKVDVRIMAATNRSLAEEVEQGRFRADLFYRLRVIPITMPPLRERPEDIETLAKHFVALFNRELAKKLSGIAPEALAMLQRYSWPGNVRELKNVIERAVLLADGETLGARELPPELSAGPHPAVAEGGATLQQVERRLLEDALAKAGGNQSHAAEALGISRHQVRTRMKRYGLLAAALLALGSVSPLRSQTPNERRASAECLRCHADLEVLARRAPAGTRPESLLVSGASLAGSAHADVPCVRCHPIPGLLPHPVEARATVPCATCHAAADSLWRAGPHGGRRGEREASCVACHGTHDIRRARDLERLEGLTVLATRCVACHTDRAFPPGDVHRGKVSCAACHGSHMVQPVRDPATHGVPVGIARRCAACHAEVAALATHDVHGRTAQDQATGRVAIHGDTAATCIACHGGHGMKPARSIDREVGLIQRCAACHRAEGESYADTYHGRATRLGYYRAARCVDCHGSHDIRPSSDPASPTSVARRVSTCARCHATAARPSFISYRAHVRAHDPSDSLPVFTAWLFMNVLLFSVFAVFGLHTLLWLSRLLVLRWNERRRRRALGLPPAPKERTPIDSADRGKGPYVWRFKLIHRLIHGVSVVSFFALVITGLPLRFSCAVWAVDMMRLLGGTRVAGLVHRTAGAVTVAYFLTHVIHTTFVILRSPNKRAMFWGPDSMVAQPQDLRDFLQMFKWFFGKAEYPRFGRYGYNEKFHYFGAFWGIVLLGGTGLVRWFPGVFTRILPGWAFNVAAVIHSEEAMLAAGFMFLIHFFNVHLRPDKFPLDGVMFTGRATFEALEADHPLTAASWGDMASRPVSARAVPDQPAPPPPRWMTLLGAGLGLLALAVGLVIVGMIMWVQLC